MWEIITNNLDLWTSAVRARSTAARSSNGKQEIYGIKKLRELILELAVRGRLVPQDPNDEPASVLLEKVATEKARLTREGVIKKEQSSPDAVEDEKPFGLPNGWQWSRLHDVSTYIQRGKGPQYADYGEVRVVSQKCIQWSGFDVTQARYVDDASLEGYQAERFLKKEDLLWNSTGTGTVGRIDVVPEVDTNQLVADSHVTIIRPLMVSSNFLWCYFAAPGIQHRIEPGHERSLVSGTTNQVELNLSAVINLIVPVPPLAEQHRIVAKVDELMALCDQLEQQQAHSIEAQEALVETMLGSLTRVESQQERTEALTRIANHFDTLFTTEHSIDQLKQTILQLAVMGKLVPQDPNDEPASVLLDQISDKKEQLVSEGKIKKENPLREIADEEKPFEVPDPWKWARFGWLVIFRSELVKPEEFADFDQVAPDSIEKGTGRLLYRRTVNESGVRGPNNRFYSGQILYSKIRPSLSKAIIAPFDGLCSADMYPLESMVDAAFLLKAILSEPFLEQVRIAENRIKMPKLNVDSLSRIVVPLPPLAEQRRIVAKVDELMTLCDAIKARVADAKAIQIHLADAIVERAAA